MMKPKSRFIKSVLDTAQKLDTDMPWSRGTRRSGFVANRAPRPAPTRRDTTA